MNIVRTTAVFCKARMANDADFAADGPKMPTMTIAGAEVHLRTLNATGTPRMSRRDSRRCRCEWYGQTTSASGFAMRTGPRDRPGEQTHWRLRELLSGQELFDEGRRMRHCVATRRELHARRLFDLVARTATGRRRARRTCAHDRDRCQRPDGTGARLAQPAADRSGKTRSRGLDAKGGIQARPLPFRVVIRRCGHESSS